MSHLLIIEDEEVIRQSLVRLLERNQFDVTATDSVEQVLNTLDINDYDLILSDIRLPGADGTTILEYTTDIPVLIMTSYASIDSAVDAMKKGAVDYISKPFNHDELLLLIRKTLKHKSAERQTDALKSAISRSYPVNGMVGNCKAMQQVFELIYKVAPTDTTVLIQGESGTGKELVARAIHESSLRSDGPFVAVNCASIPENLIESELFGHEKGAFTGATSARKGLIESANEGTLFLDEIGELSAPVQSRLLRFLQENEIRRVGSDHAKKINVRTISATNRELQKDIQKKLFREDLYFRLKVMEILLPPLREREDDRIKLAEFLLGKSTQQLNSKCPGFSKAAIDAIKQYNWPGNVRELGNAVERAVILCDNNAITPDHLALTASQTNRRKTDNLSLDDYFIDFVRNHEDQMNETELAKQLGISRKTLWERRQKLGIPRSK